MDRLLPRFCVIQSQSHYVRYDATDGQKVTCDGEKITDPLSKFKVERAMINKGYIHIRCCFNNKYLRLLNKGQQVYVVVAASVALNEDRFDESCTLFEPVLDEPRNEDRPEFTRLKHVQTGYTVYFHDDNRGLSLTPDPTVDGSLFRIIDWESLVILPQYVAFRSEKNKGKKKYLCSPEEGESYVLEFTTDDLGNPRVGEEIITHNNGTISLIHKYNGKYWRMDKTCVYADGDSPSDDHIFRPVKLEGNEIALLSLKNNKFLLNFNVDLLQVLDEYTTIGRLCHLEVVELVAVRRIYNVVYRKEDAKVQVGSGLTLARSTVSNRTEKDQEYELSMAYTDTWKYEWSNNNSVSTSFGMKFSASIPRFLEKSIQESGKKEDDYDWGKQEDGSLSLTKTIKVNVPKMTKTTVSLLATLGWGEIPFTYTQQDTLVDGSLQVTANNEGIYTCANCYHIRTKITKEPIPVDKKSEEPISVDKK